MPQNKYALARYGLIDQMLRKDPYVKTSSIARTCKVKLGYNISQRTIQMDLVAMKDDAFLGIYAPIEYCKKRRSYYYTRRDFVLNPVNFSDKEVGLLESICDMLSNKIDEEDVQSLKVIVKKIKRFYAAK